MHWKMKIIGFDVTANPIVKWGEKWEERGQEAFQMIQFLCLRLCSDMNPQ